MVFSLEFEGGVVLRRLLWVEEKGCTLCNLSGGVTVVLFFMTRDRVVHLQEWAMVS